MQAQSHHPEDHLAGKVVLITGAGRGLGRELALVCAHAGAIVAANDITPINLDETIAQVEAVGGRIRPYLADIASKLAIQTLLAEVLDDWGVIDILINHAQVRPRAGLLEIDEWDWRRAMDVNLTGAFLLIQSVARTMQASGGGQIINLAEDTGPLAFMASKAGLAGLTQPAAAELQAHNIRINTIYPFANEQMPPEQQTANNSLPSLLQTAARPSELVLRLCHPDMAGVTGQIIYFRES